MVRKKKNKVLPKKLLVTIGLVMLILGGIVFLFKKTIVKPEIALVGNEIVPTHVIGVRPGVNGAEFVNKITNVKFVPRGTNYIRLAKISDPWNGDIMYHSTFDPGKYDAKLASEALTRMNRSGYNTVRVFISDSAIGVKTGGLSSEYMKNVSGFIKLAKTNRIYVILTFPYLPKLGGYYPQNSNVAQIEGENWFILGKEAVEAKVRYITDFIGILKSESAPLENIMSYEIENEVVFNKLQKPLSLKVGVVKTANGGSYNMASSLDRQQMMDSNLVYWSNEVRVGILNVDPTALVSVGMFDQRAVDIRDPRVIRNYWLLTSPAEGGSSLDFVDLHFYPGKYSVSEAVSSFELDKVSRPLSKPVILGEYGAYKKDFPDLVKAAYSLRDIQIESCKYGFSGWLLWTFDTSEMSEMWNLLDNKGSINGVLAPIVRSDPCK